MAASRFLSAPAKGLSRSISTLLPVLAIAGFAVTVQGETWTVGAGSTGIWSDAANWTEGVGGGTVATATPPGVAGVVYDGVRLNINGPITYTAAEGTQVYDASVIGGEGRALGIANTGTAGHLTLSGGTLTLVQEASASVGFIGSTAGAVGSLTLNGGNLVVNDADGDGTFAAVYGAGAIATVNIGSGSTMSVDRIHFSEGSAATGTLNLNSGGILETRAIREINASGTSTLNFDAGTLRVKGPEAGGIPLIASSIDTVNVLAGGVNVDTNNFNARIAKQLSGAGGLTKIGQGTLILESDSASTFTGTTTVNAGTLQIGNGGTTGSIGSGALTLASGTTLGISRSDALSQSTFTGAGTPFQSGLGGDVGFAKGGSGIFTVDVANTYTGATTVNGGVLRLTNPAGLGSTTGATTVATGASVALSGITVSGENITINFDGGGTTGGEIAIASRGALQGSIGSSTWTGNVTMGSSNSRIGIQEGASITVTGTISDGGAGHTIIFRGANTPGGLITLSGTGNTWGRTEIYGYTTRIAGNNVLPTSAPLAVGITSPVIPESIFDLNGFNQEVGGLTQASSTTGVITNSGSTDSVLTLNGTLNQTYLGRITDGATNKTSLVKNGSFTQVLANDNTYTGSTTVNGGTLQLGNNTATGSIGSGTLTLAAGTTLGISRSDDLSQSTFTGAGAAFRTGLSGDVGFTKGGNGVFTADVANTYTGATTVTDGFLRVTHPAALGAPGGANKVTSGGSLVLSGGITVNGEDLTINGTGETVSNGTEFAATHRGALQSSIGDNTFGGNIFVEAALTRIGAQDGASLTVTGSITGGAPGQEFIFRSGVNSLITLSGTGNSWLSDTHLYGGTLRNGVNNALSTGSTLIMGAPNVTPDSTYDLNGFNQTVAGLSNNAGFSGSSTITNKGSNDSTLTLDGTVDRSFTGVLSDGATNKLSLVKNGTFAQTLTSASSYTGPTTINAGALVVSGSIGASAVTVNGGTLTGGGIVGPTTVNNSGILSPGAGLGSMNVGAVTLNSGATFTLEIDTSSMIADFTFVGGDFKLALDNSSTLSLIDLGGNAPMAPGTVLPLLSYSGAWNGGLFQVAGVPIADNTGVFTLGANHYSIDYNAPGNTVSLVVVPEPGSAMLLLGGAGALLGFRRRATRPTR